MLTRRDFLRGLIASVASAALVKNGVAQPAQVVGMDWAEGADRSIATVFDMAANTWRESTNELHVQWVATSGWSFFAQPERFNCRCVLPETDGLGGYLIPPEHLKEVRQFLKDGGAARGRSIFVPLRDTAPEEVSQLRGVNMPDYSNNPFPKLDNFGISSDVVAKRIGGLQTAAERTQAFCQAVLKDDARRAIDGIPS